MKHFRILFTLLLFATLNLAFAQQQNKQSDTLFQISTLSALLEGDYEGRASFQDVKRHGDFGLGTFAALDGEMIAIDGVFYQVRVDGMATPVNKDQTTPFAAVTFFSADDTFHITDEISCSELYSLLQNQFPSDQSLYAIKIKGYFTELDTRSVPAQQQPYPTLIEALQEQVIFNHTAIKATMVGYWLPDTVADINVAGFHFHAVTDALTGGHVLGCIAHDIEVEIDYTHELQIQFSDGQRPHPPLPKPGHLPQQQTWPPVSHW